MSKPTSLQVGTVTTLIVDEVAVGLRSVLTVYLLGSAVGAFIGFCLAMVFLRG